MARGVILMCGFLAATPAWAQSLPDPTRPANTSAEAGVATSGPTLQSIRTVAGVRTAVIGGQEVKVGSVVADQRVVRIDEDQVVLRGSAGQQTLKLFPGVAKTTRGADPEPAKRRGESAKRKEAR
jgi:hypothetical protein